MNPINSYQSGIAARSGAVPEPDVHPSVGVYGLSEDKIDQINETVLGCAYHDAFKWELFELLFEAQDHNIGPERAVAAAKYFIDRAFNSEKYNTTQYLVECDPKQKAEHSRWKLLSDLLDKCGIYGHLGLDETLEVAKHMIRKGVDVNRKVGCGGVTLLDLWSTRGNINFVKFLVENGTDLDSVDIHEKKALDSAIIHRKAEVAHYLVDQMISRAPIPFQEVEPGVFRIF